ncbi:TrmB family transcriptional regulator [Halopelagius longus]|uniref:Sugar-specific transcriptional regulator TrmB n=1 Tax=Halopelagius longus TaxID=1236180 RepID=A0A1H1C9J3_9EURY|nr:helix-turn-helix domain-containing protein [Halopelagius longus]RDI71130.1 TrmB family transcriptional regulator [Halopelagius longus]SDQ60814.1 Sugar-specific transcriptional regulator TrmB [Halopelagius longus]
MSTGPDAVEALGNLGLTEYEARCFIALNRVERATAKEISELSDVPRSRVYDTVDKLHKRGLVDIQQSDPRQYRAVSKEQAFEKLRTSFDKSVEEADAALEEVGSAETQEEKGTWSIANAEHVEDRIVALIADVDDRIHYLVADESTVSDDILDGLSAAADRGVTVVAEVPTESLRDRIEENVPDADVRVAEDLVETNSVVEKWPGQLLMGDQQAVLASGLETGEGPWTKRETAVWTHGHDHGFAAWIRELLDDRLVDS